jgi:hypothetical protein
MAAVMQVSARPTLHNYAAASGDWRHQLVEAEFVWPKAIRRVAAEGISPRAGGRRGDRADQRDLGRVASGTRAPGLDTAHRRASCGSGGAGALDS